MTATHEAVVPWDVVWAHEQAVKALEWLAKNYPECSGSEGLSEHDRAVTSSTATGEREAYLEALRGYCRAGRDEALRIRRGAA